MPKLFIERSIEIDAPAKSIFSVLMDFKKWPYWSPWLIMDPDTKLSYTEDGRSYTWVSPRIGSGKMSIRNSSEPHEVQYDLQFLKPWKSSSRVSFHLDEKDGRTQVTWKMDSALPFFLFWMKKMMKAYVGADYVRGLDMLKAYVEGGEVFSKLDFVGFADFSGTRWVGVKTSSSLEIIGTSMEADYGVLRAFASQNSLDGLFMTIYHKWDIVRNKCTYVAAMQVQEWPESIPNNFVKGEIPPTRVYKLKHIGAYKHLGNAWSTLYSMMRSKEIKTRKNIHPFEVYLNDPSKTPERDLVTEINIPVRS